MQQLTGPATRHQQLLPTCAMIWFIRSLPLVVKAATLLFPVEELARSTATCRCKHPVQPAEFLFITLTWCSRGI